MKKETDTELLARLMVEGFGQVNARFDGIDERFDGIDGRLDGIDNRLDGIDGRLDGIDGRLNGIDIDLVEVKDRLLSLEKGQINMYRSLDAMKKKQSGTLLSLDETVPRREFIKLVHRVEVLEK